MQGIGINLNQVDIDKVKKQFNELLDDLQKQANNKKIEIGIENINTIKNQVNNLQNTLNSINTSKSQNEINSLGDSYDKLTTKYNIISTLGEEHELLTQKVKQWTNTEGIAIKETKNYIQQTDGLGNAITVLSSKQKEYNDNSKQKATEEKRINEAIQNQIKLLQTKAQLLKQNYWTGDFTQLNNFTKQLDSSKVDPNNYKIQLAELSNQYRIIANTTQESHRNNLASLNKEIVLETQKNASVMQNWAKQLEVDSSERKNASDKIKSQMEFNALKQSEIDLEKRRIALLGEKVNSSLNVKSSSKEIQDFVRNLTDTKGQVMSIVPSFDRLGNEMTKVIYKTKDGSDKWRTYQLTIDKATDSTYQLDKGLREVQNRNLSMSEALKIAFVRISQWAIATQGVYGTLRKIREGISFLNETNKDLTSISMITGMTSDQTKRLSKEYADLGLQMGITTSEILKGSLEWFRQGKSVQETQELMKASIMEAKLAGIDTAQATEYLTSTLNGYKLEAKSATDVVSKMVAVDNIAATSVAELSAALQRSAVSASEAGVGLDKLISWVGTVSSVSRKSASSIGESYKTIFARMQDIKANKLDEDGIGISDVENALNRVGIALRKNEIEFRDMSDVVDDIAKKWKDIDSDLERSNIAKSVAGTRQRENFLILMNNYNKSLELEKASLESAGLAQERYSIYLQSTEARMAQLVTTGQKFWLNFLDSKLINGVIINLTGLVSNLDQVVNYSKMLGVSLIGLSVAFGLVSRTLKGFTLSEYILMTHKAITATNLLTMAQTGLAGATSLVKNAFMFLFATPLGWITLAIGGVLALTNHLKNQREEVEKLTNTYNNYKTALESIDIEAQKQSYNELVELQKQLDDLYEQKNKQPSGSEASFAIQQGYDNKIKEVIKQIKDLGFNVDETTGKIKDLKNILRNIEADKEIKRVQNFNDELIKQKDNIEGLINKYLSLNNVEKKTIYQRETMSKIAVELKSKYDDLIIATDEQGNSTIKNIEILNDKINVLNSERDAIKENAKTRIETIVDTMKIQVDNTVLTIRQVKARISAYQEEIDMLEGLGNKTAQIQRKSIENKKSQYQTAYDNSMAYLDSLLTKYTNNSSGIYTPPKGSGDKSSSKSPPTLKDSISQEDLTKELIKSYNKEVDITDQKLKHLERQLKINDEQKDYNKELEITNELISAQETKLSQLEEANRKIHQEANRLRKENKLGLSEKTIESFFDVNGEASLAYKEYLNTFATRTQEIRNKTDESNKKSIESANEQIKALEKEKKQVEELFNNIYALKKAWEGNTDEILKTKDTIDGLSKSINEMSLKKMTEQKKAIEDIIDLTVKMIKQQKEDEIEALDDQLKKYKEIIDAKKEQLRLTEEQRDYERELGEKQKDVSKIQNRIAVLRLDTSREAQAEILRLEEELSKKQADLDEHQHDRGIKLQEQALDKDYKNFEENVKDKIKSIKDYLSQTGKMTSDAMKMIDEQSDTIYQSLIEWNNLYGNSIEQDITNAWESAKLALQEYQDLLGNMDIEKTLNTLSNLSDKNNKNKAKNSSEQDIINQMKLNSQNWHNASPEEKKYLENQNKILASMIGAIWNNKLSKWFKNGIPLYHSGLDKGFVGGSALLKSNEQFAKLLKGELIINPIQMDNFMTKTLPDITNMNNNGLKIDKLVDIKVMGNMDSSTIPKIDEIVNKAVDRLNETFNTRGTVRSVKVRTI